MKRVLFINHSNNLHGAETVMLQLIERVFQEEKNNAFIILPKTKNESKFKSFLEEKGFNNCFQLPYKSLGGTLFRSLVVLFYNVFSMFKFISIIRKEKIDIVYSNTSITCIGIFLAKIMGKKHIWHFHEPIEEAHGWNKSLCFFYKISLLYKKNMTVFVSQKQKQQWLNQLPNSFNNSKIIYDPILKIRTNDRVLFKNNLTFGYLGSRDKRKNIPLFLSVFYELSLKYPEIRLILAKNTGEDNSEIEKFIDTFLSDKVIEENYKDASDFYSNIDVFVLPSLSETWGMVALEALSVKKALILTKNTGLHEILENNIDCIFIDPLSKKELYSSIEKLIINTLFRTEISNNGFEKIKQLDFNNQFQLSFQHLFK